MDYAGEITKALEHVPNHIALAVLEDIDKRISDWLASGGDPDAPYIIQQVNHAKRVGIVFGQQKSH